MRKVYIGVVTLMSLGIKTSKKSDIKNYIFLTIKKILKKKSKRVRIFELLNEGYTERFREIYAESSSEILGIEIDFWLTPQ